VAGVCIMVVVILYYTCAAINSEAT
jgi:hypothetical protein